MRYARSWERLLEHLSEVGGVTEPAPGRVRVSVGSPPRDIEIVMTRDEWSAMSSVVWGDVDAAAGHVAERLLGLPPEQGYLVYDDGYDVQGSAAPEIPEEPDEVRMRELMKQHPGGIPGGYWVTYDRDGNEVRFDPEAPD